MKRTILIILSVLVMAGSVFAQTENDFEITQNKQGGITITKYTGKITNVVIPSTIEGIKVTEIGGRAFQGTDPAAGGIYEPMGSQWGERNAIAITSVVIPNTVTSIGTRAFYDQRISEVIIPDSVTYIGEMAFAYGRISTLTLGRNIQEIGVGAFASNYITSVTLPASLRIVRKGAFQYNRLARLIIPNGVVFLDTDSFGNNPIATLVIPQSLTVSDDKIFVSRDRGFIGAFSNKEKVSTFSAITLPANVDVRNFYDNFPNSFQSFYESQGKKAGTYIWTGRLWRVGTAAEAEQIMRDAEARQSSNTSQSQSINIPQVLIGIWINGIGKTPYVRLQYEINQNTFVEKFTYSGNVLTYGVIKCEQVTNTGQGTVPAIIRIYPSGYKITYTLIEKIGDNAQQVGDIQTFYVFFNTSKTEFWDTSLDERNNPFVKQ